MLGGFQNVQEVLECCERTRVQLLQWVPQTSSIRVTQKPIRSAGSRARPKPAGSESAFQHDPQRIHTHILKTSLRSTGLKGWESSRMFRFHRHLKCIQERRRAETDYEGRKEEGTSGTPGPARPPLQGRAPRPCGGWDVPTAPLHQGCPAGGTNHPRA